MTNSTSSPTTQKATNKFWEFRNQANSQSAELLLYGDISQSSWWGDEVTPKQFSDDLAGLGDVSEITVRINSSGGDVFAADAIGNQLEQHPAAVTAKIDGLCASAATILLPSVFLVGEWQQRERQQHDQAAASERHRFLQGQRGGDRGHGGMN